MVSGSIPANSKKIHENLLVWNIFGVGALRKCSEDNYKLKEAMSWPWLVDEMMH